MGKEKPWGAKLSQKLKPKLERFLANQHKHMEVLVYVCEEQN